MSHKCQPSVALEQQHTVFLRIVLPKEGNWQEVCSFNWYDLMFFETKLEMGLWIPFNFKVEYKLMYDFIEITYKFYVHELLIVLNLVLYNKEN